MPQLAVSTQVFGEREVALSHLEVMRRVGFQWVEVFAAPGHFDWQEEAAVQRMAGWLRELDMRVCSLHAPWAPGQDIAALDDAQRERSLRAVERAVDALVALSGHYLIMHPGEAPAGAQAKAVQMRHAEESLRRIARHCAAHGVQAALENPPPYELCGATADMQRLYRRLAGEPALCACFDTGHAHCTPAGVAGIARVPAPVAVIHLSDNTGVADDHLPPVEGTIDWDSFFGLLARRAWEGFLVVELTDRQDAAVVLARGMHWLNITLEKSIHGI